MKILSSTVVALAIAGVTSLAYLAWLNHSDQETYRRNLALLAAQEAAPTTWRTVTMEGVNWYEKCEKGLCSMATDPESLAGSMVRTKGSMGIPVTDLGAVQQLERQVKMSP